MDEFKALKPEIDSVILKGPTSIRGGKESSDSTAKKLIY